MSEVLVIVTVLAAAALAWRSYRVRRDLNREITRLETLNDIGRVLLTDRNLRGVLRLVAERAARLLGADTAHVTQSTPDGSRLVLEAATGPLAPFVGSAVPVEGSTAGWVLRHVQPLLANHPDREPGRFGSVHERVPLRRSVVLPLIVKGRCVGALGVDNPRDNRPFGEADVEVLRDLANYTALVIESLRAVEELAGRERRAALLNAVNSRIRQSLDLQMIVDAAVRELGTALGVSRCLVRLRRGNELLPTAGEWRAPEARSPDTLADPSLPLLTAAVRLRRTIETSDVRKDPLAAGLPKDGEPLAVLATPIVLRGEAIGVIAFHHAGMPRLWRPEEIGMVEEVADELGIAISNARLYRSVEETSRELAAKISELERVNRLKAQFLANMSHELRTPLNSVIGFSEMLLLGAQGPLGAEQRDALETVARNGRHLLGLVNDVLDLAKIEAGRQELTLAPTDLRALITDVMTGMESLIQAKGHRVALNLADGALVVTADALRIRQVLFNLLSNAVKFTPPGGEIRVSGARRRAPFDRAQGQGDRETVWVAVSDSGIGIAPEDMPRLFTEFTQLDASYARQHEGTGLGLALCKRLVDLHGGRIGVESAKGRGSTFWVELPVGGPQDGR